MANPHCKLDEISLMQLKVLLAQAVLRWQALVAGLYAHVDGD
jgi:hypothetical protein